MNSAVSGKEKLVKIHLPAFVVPNADEGGVRKESVWKGSPVWSVSHRAVCPCTSIADSTACVRHEQLVAAALCPISLSPSSCYLTLLLGKQDTGTLSIFCLFCVSSVVW